MFYLSGERTDVLDRVVALSGGAMPGPDSPDLGVGLIMQPLTAGFTEWAHIYPVCAIDNGCFTPAGQRRFTLPSYLKLIEKGLRAWGEHLLWATAPDVAFDWDGTLRKSLPTLDAIRRAGCPAALVLQDGATVEQFDREGLWERCDALFIGGSTEWKIGAEAKRLSRAMKRRRPGSWVHMGRVNSVTRMRIAHDFGCDSADGTYLLHETMKDNEQGAVAEMVSWMQDVYRRQQPPRRNPTRRAPTRQERAAWHRLNTQLMRPE